MAEDLNQEEVRVSHRLVAKWLDEMDDSWQGTRNIKEGTDPPDRDDPFRFMAEKSKACQPAGQPVIWVATKQKERIGE